MAHQQFRSIRHFAAVVGALLLLVVAGASPVFAQGSSGQSSAAQPAPPPGAPWSVEIYGGALFGSSTPSGSAIGTLPVGADFTTGGGRPSRSVPSWYFGDGAQLFNQVSNDFAARYGRSITRIDGLDPVLRGAATTVKPGASFGVRITRSLTRRIALEVAFERSTRPLQLSGAGQASVEAARDSFQAAFQSLAANLPQSNLVVTSTADITEPPAGATVISAALVLSVLQRGPIGAHVLGGVGGSFGGSGALDIRMRGNYQFQLFGTFPISESDLVTVNIDDESGTAIGVFGGGITYALSPQHAIRMDVRLRAGTAGVRTTVSATPARSTVTPPVFISSETNPSVQFSNASGVRTTLSGEPLTALETFSSSGLEIRGQVTVGFVLRF